MITDKDREDTRKAIHDAMMQDKYLMSNKQEREQYALFILENYTERIRTESAEQARKDAAKRVRELAGKDCFRNPGYGEGYERGLYDAYLAILGDSVVKENLITDHIPDTVEKLAIAVKALEYVVSKSLPSSAFESHYSRLQDACAKASDALKEIQG